MRAATTIDVSIDQDAITSPGTAPVASASMWRKQDTVWMLGLYGTAVGAGTLFLPIDAGLGGFWPLVLMALLALPMTYFSHRALTRFVLSGSSRNGEDITEVVEEHFGTGAGKLITLLYFFAIFPILLVYSVAVTNTVSSFIVNQLGWQAPPRAVLSLALILGLMLIVRCGERVIVKTMSVLVFPFVAVLLMMSLYLIPHWQVGEFIHHSASATPVDFLKTLWLAIPVMVFSFNHSPIISTFAVDQKREYGKDADKKSGRILVLAHTLMVVTVMFFVFSCVFALSSADLVAAKAQNISILSYLANRFNQPIIQYAAPLIAFVAITKSFLGHYIGASEGLKGIVVKELRSRGKQIEDQKLNRYTAIFMVLVAWLVATLNPSILTMIESMGGPVIAILLFLMPMYAIHKVPAMRKYSGAVSNIFVVTIGVITISAALYSLL